MFTQQEALAAIFLPGEVIGFSGPTSAPFRSWHKPAAGSVYFCINPLVRGLSPLRNEFIKEARNFLVEFDKTTLASQKATIKRLKIPYSIKTWSGGKSLQLIISLSEPCADEAEYKYLFRMLVAIIPKIDDDVGTLSRLARLPNAIRDNGEEQTLLDVTGVKLTKQELIDWAYRANCVAFNKWKWEESEAARKRSEREVRRLTEAPPETENYRIPFVFQRILDTGEWPRDKYPKRHDVLINAGRSLNYDQLPLDYIENVLYQLQSAIGLIDRNDVPGIIKHLAKIG